MFKIGFGGTGGSCNEQHPPRLVHCGHRHPARIFARWVLYASGGRTDSNSVGLSGKWDRINADGMPWEVAEPAHEG